jgi:hypothetical protein
MHSFKKKKFCLFPIASSHIWKEVNLLAFTKGLGFMLHHSKEEIVWGNSANRKWRLVSKLTFHLLHSLFIFGMSHGQFYAFSHSIVPALWLGALQVWSMSFCVPTLWLKLRDSSLEIQTLEIKVKLWVEMILFIQKKDSRCRESSCAEDLEWMLHLTHRFLSIFSKSQNKEVAI